jgi:hypothetical protein
MPDQTVQVTFDPNATPQFTFTPSSVTMTGSGKVILEQSPANAAWTFDGAAVKDDTLDEFKARVVGNGQVVHIDDQFKDRQETGYSYDVTVALNGQTYTSPDPEIVNDPGSVERAD